MKNKTKFLNMKFIGIMVAVTGLSILYVFQRIQITDLGYQVRKEEVRLDKLLDEKARLMSLISSLESPSNIQRIVADSKLSLEHSKNPKVVKVKL